MRNTHQPRAALYLRLSDDRRGTGDNVADQERGGRKVAERLGAKVVRIYNDNDHPASEPKRKPRPDFEQMLKDAEAGDFDLLIIRHADRLYRTPFDQGRIADVFGPRRIVIHQEWAGYPLDLSTPSGILNAGIMAQVAQYETNHKRERQKAHNRQHISQGNPPEGGPVPFGYEADRLTPKEPEAQMIRDAHKALLRGATLASIIRKWNDSGVTAPRGGRWSYSTLRGVLTRPLNAGLVVYDGKVLPGVKGKWTPLVSEEEEHYAVVALLNDPSRRTNNSGSARKHLLAGLARCGSCGRPLKSGGVTLRSGRKHPLYRCTSRECTAKVHVAREHLNAEVERRFLAERGDLPVRRLVSMTGEDAEALADLEARIKATSARLAEDDADVESLVARLAELKAERTRLRQMPRMPVIESGTVAEAWAKATTIERKRELLLGHLASGGLRVTPKGKVSHRFDPQRVLIEWQPVLLKEASVRFTADDGEDFASIPA